MILCDKCKKKLRRGDGNSRIGLGYNFTYDLCSKCEEKFLLHVDSFFNTKESNEENV